MKSKNIITAVLTALLFAMPAVNAAVTDKTPVAQDFTFGLSDKFPAVKPYEDGETGEAMWERFLQVRQELPEELPVFKPYEPFGEHKIYVAKNGSDSNKGTIDEPVKTIEKAIELAATGEMGKGKVIYIREGIYDVSTGLKLPEGLSGTEKAPTFISAYPGEDVVLSGGVSVKGSEFKVADDAVAMRKLPLLAQGKVYSVNLYDLGYSNLPDAKTAKLSVDGNEYTIARWPNSTTVPMGQAKGEGIKDGVYDIGPVTSGLHGNAITGDTGEGFEFMFIDPRPLSWENNDDIWMFGSFAVEYTRGYKRIRSINEDKMSIRTYECEGLGARYDSHNSYYYLNILEELDIPGEWYFDKATGMLYLWPISDLENSEVSISKSTNDLVTFDHGSQHIVLNDVKISSTGGKGVVISGFRNLVQNCVVEGVGGTGVYIRYAKNSGVINSDIYGTGISIWGSINEESTPNSDPQSLRPTRNFAQNNSIYNPGCGIMVRYGTQHVVTHNTIMNAASQAIYVAETQETIIEYNEATGSPWKTRDGGTLYHEGGFNNLYNHIRYNYFHHTTLELREWPFMIYLDDLTCCTFVYGNIMQMGYSYLHGGSWNVMYNNVAIDCPTNNSITNCDQYITGFQQVMTDGIINPSGGRMLWNGRSGTMKINHEKIRKRYPMINHFVTELQQVRINRIKDPTCINDETEIEMKEPQGCVYKNNVAYNTLNARVMDVETREMFENNYRFESSDIFEDYENRNYNIKPDSEVYEKIDDFEALPPIEKIGIIDLKEDIEQGEMYPINPANDPDIKAFPSDILFKWTPSYPATFYTIEIALDEGFENIVETARTQEAYYQCTKELDLDTIYYWRVKAESYAGHVKNPEIVMETAAFKTYTYDEAAANTSLNTAVYDSEHDRIKQYADELYEDDGKDYGVQPFKQGTKEQIYKLLEASKKRVGGYALQSEVDKEITSLNNSFTKILLDNAVEYVRTYSADDISMWNINSNNGTVTAENGIISIKAIKDGASATATDQRLLAPGEKVKIRVKFPIKSFEGIGIKQIPSEVAGGFYGKEGYYIVVTPDAIELQRYPQTNGDIVTSVKNDGLMKPDGWHDVEFSCTPEGEGQRIVIGIDGKEVINYFDDVAPNNKMGYVSIQGRFEPTELKDE